MVGCGLAGPVPNRTKRTADLPRSKCFDGVTPRQCVFVFIANSWRRPAELMGALLPSVLNVHLLAHPCRQTKLTESPSWNIDTAMRYSPRLIFTVPIASLSFFRKLTVHASASSMTEITSPAFALTPSSVTLVLSSSYTLAGDCRRQRRAQSRHIELNVLCVGCIRGRANKKSPQPRRCSKTRGPRPMERLRGRCLVSSATTRSLGCSDRC